MIPILYESTETEFTTNGIGRLTDALSCIVTEERNGSFELSMVYPITGIHYSDILNSRIISAVSHDGGGRQPFDIYKISKPINGNVTIYARHISYRLSKIITGVMAVDYLSAGDALSGIKNNALTEVPFTFATDNNAEGTFRSEAPGSIKSKMLKTTGSIIDVFGGEFEWDGWNVMLHSSRGSNNGVTLRYGKNITDLKQEESIDATVTGIYPYWKSSKSGSNVYRTLSAPVYCSNADKYNYKMVEPVDCSSSFKGTGVSDYTGPTDEELTTWAKNYIDDNNIGTPSVSLTVSFVALWQTNEYKKTSAIERVKLCDTVSVIFDRLGVKATAKVVKTVYNVLLDKYSSISIGDAKSTLSDAVAKNASDIVDVSASDKDYMQDAINYATKLIQGGLGGHVVFNTNANGQPNEILIMDTEDKSTAVNVIRMNVNGIGFSTNGYSGPYETAWTIDGHFNADYITSGAINASLITTGTLDASVIRSGIIADKLGNTTWNLETGALSSKKLSITSDNFTLDTNGYVTMQGATIKNGELLLQNTDGTGLLLKDGVIYATKDNKKTGASIKVGSDGYIWFDGNVGKVGGYTGSYPYTKNLVYDSGYIAGQLSTDSLVTNATASTTLSGGNISLSQGSIYVSTQFITVVTSVNYDTKWTQTQNITYVTGVTYSPPSINYNWPSASTTLDLTKVSRQLALSWSQGFFAHTTISPTEGKINFENGFVTSIE